MRIPAVRPLEQTAAALYLIYKEENTHLSRTEAAVDSDAYCSRMAVVLGHSLKHARVSLPKTVSVRLGVFSGGWELCLDGAASPTDALLSTKLASDASDRELPKLFSRTSTRNGLSGAVLPKYYYTTTFSILTESPTTLRHSTRFWLCSIGTPKNRIDFITKLKAFINNCKN